MTTEKKGRAVRVGDFVRSRSWNRMEWPSGHEVTFVSPEGFSRTTSKSIDVKSEDFSHWYHVDGAAITGVVLGDQNFTPRKRVRITRNELVPAIPVGTLATIETYDPRNGNVKLIVDGWGGCFNTSAANVEPIEMSTKKGATDEGGYESTADHRGDAGPGPVRPDSGRSNDPGRTPEGDDGSHARAALAADGPTSSIKGADPNRIRQRVIPPIAEAKAVAPVAGVTHLDIARNWLRDYVLHTEPSAAAVEAFADVLAQRDYHREQAKSAFGSLNRTEAGRRAHRNAMQAWADDYAVRRPSMPTERDAALWKACTEEFSMRVPLISRRDDGGEELYIYRLGERVRVVGVGVEGDGRVAKEDSPLHSFVTVALKGQHLPALLRRADVFSLENDPPESKMAHALRNISRNVVDESFPREMIRNIAENTLAQLGHKTCEPSDQKPGEIPEAPDDGSGSTANADPPSPPAEARKSRGAIPSTAQPTVVCSYGESPATVVIHDERGCEPCCEIHAIWRLTWCSGIRGHGMSRNGRSCTVTDWAHATTLDGVDCTSDVRSRPLPEKFHSTYKCPKIVHEPGCAALDPAYVHAPYDCNCGPDAKPKGTGPINIVMATARWLRSFSDQLSEHAYQELASVLEEYAPSPSRPSPVRPKESDAALGIDDHAIAGMMEYLIRVLEELTLHAVARDNADRSVEALLYQNLREAKKRARWLRERAERVGSIDDLGIDGQSLRGKVTRALGALQRTDATTANTAFDAFYEIERRAWEAFRLVKKGVKS